MDYKKIYDAKFGKGGYTLPQIYRVYKNLPPSKENSGGPEFFEARPSRLGGIKQIYPNIDKK